MSSETSLAFGPVPSRRLGKSLGVNNIPPKNCSYSCIYCQVGRTKKMTINRQPFYSPDEIARAVRNMVDQTRCSDKNPDYITIVPDGEPTLDIRLKDTIDQLHQTGLPVAVISNATLISREDVRNDLARADWVSLKVDALNESVWRKTDRPHGKLVLDDILAGILSFSRLYTGALVTETMLVENVNDNEEELSKIGRFLGEVKPSVAYISAPIRPPAEKWATPPGEETLHFAYQEFSKHTNTVEFLISYEGDDFFFANEVEKELLGITAVHPMREDAVFAFFAKAGAEKKAVQDLVDQKLLKRVSYRGEWFYLRSF